MGIDVERDKLPLCPSVSSRDSTVCLTVLSHVKASTRITVNRTEAETRNGHMSTESPDPIQVLGKSY